MTKQFRSSNFFILFLMLIIVRATQAGEVKRASRHPISLSDKVADIETGKPSTLESKLFAGAPGLLSAIANNKSAILGAAAAVTGGTVTLSVATAGIAAGAVAAAALATAASYHVYKTYMTKDMGIPSTLVDTMRKQANGDDAEFEYLKTSFLQLKYDPVCERLFGPGFFVQMDKCKLQERKTNIAGWTQPLRDKNKGKYLTAYDAAGDKEDYRYIKGNPSILMDELACTNDLAVKDTQEDTSIYAKLLGGIPSDNQSPSDPRQTLHVTKDLPESSSSGTQAEEPTLSEPGQLEAAPAK